MSATAAESETHPKTSGRARIANWLNKTFSLSVSEDDPELIKKARAFGTDAFGRRDPLVEHGIRQCQEEEQRAREQRHDQQQQQVAQRIEQQTVQSAQQQSDILDIWWHNKLALAVGFDNETPRHPSIAALLDAIGEVIAEVNVKHEKALRREIDHAKKYAHELVCAFTKELHARFIDPKALFQTAERRHNDAMEQVTQRLATIEGTLATMGSAVDDIKHQLTNTDRDINKRIGELEVRYSSQREQDEKRDSEQTKLLSDRLTAVERDSGNLQHDLADGHKRLADLETAYWDQRETDQRQRERDAQTSAGQTKIFSDRLTAVERHSGDLKRELADGSKRLGDLENTYWSQRDSDQHQRDEQANKVMENLNGFAQQVVDFAHELKEVRRDLKRATDMTQEIHQMELRLDERRIAAEENKRGPQGIPGSKGPKGDTGPAGKAGRDGRDAPTVKTKKWEINAEEFLAREVLSDGSRMPALNLRPFFEEYQRQTSA